MFLKNLFNVCSLIIHIILCILFFVFLAVLIGVYIPFFVLFSVIGHGFLFIEDTIKGIIHAKI